MKYLLQFAAALLGTMGFLTAHEAWAQDHIAFELSSKASRPNQAAAATSPDVFLPDDDGDSNNRVASRPIRQWFRGLSANQVGSEPTCGGECGVSCESKKCADDDGVGLGAICNSCGEGRLPIGMTLFSGVESWRNISDLFLSNNTGIVVGGNLGVPLPRLGDYGIGAQMGASFGAYDLDGRTTLQGGPAEVQQQIFVTAGLFRRATDDAPINLGIVYDWMVNDGYGVFSTAPTMGQCRAQIGYNLDAHNEVGVWGAVNGRRSVKLIAYNLNTPSTYRAINQFDLFWHHNFESGADGWLWLGVPEKENIGGDGRLGEFTIGATMNVPVTQRMALYASGEFMKPAASASLAGAVENAYTIGFGLMFFPRGCARNRNVAGDRWTPYVPLANNGNFLIDTDAVPL